MHSLVEYSHQQSYNPPSHLDGTTREIDEKDEHDYYDTYNGATYLQHIQ